MNRSFIKSLGVLAIIAFAAFFTSCDKEEESFTSIENFVLNSVTAIEDQCGAGRDRCFELVFPVTISFSDGTTAEVGDYKELKQAIRTWYYENGGHPTKADHPTLVLPIQVINEAGEIITIETPEQLKELREECGPRPGGHHGEPCFTLNFPVTISFADSSQVEVNSREEFKDAVLAWKEANPDQHARPHLVFPITVTMTDGTEVEVENPLALRQLKKDCRG
jgi:hypothetical protein